jgi:FtsP/CotA-like multicopper oxidase with cupredoxin domain
MRGVLGNTHVLRALAALGVLLFVALTALVGKAWWDSRLPSSYSVMQYGQPDYGGAPPTATGHGGHGGPASVADLKGPSGKPDFALTLTALEAKVRIEPGRLIDALTFNGRVPGPEIRVRQHQLVQVTLVNQNIEKGVSIHWHGVDVPNAEDGVAGVTQDAVLPGERYTYRFRADQVGTFWYHSHQFSADQVKRGLYGAFVIEPARRAAGTTDLSVAVHTFAGKQVFGTSDDATLRTIPSGRDVRLRLINTDDAPRKFHVNGVPFKVLAIDGADLNEPTPIGSSILELGGGARYDVGFEMPSHAVSIGITGSEPGLVVGPAGAAPKAPAAPGPIFDPATYGTPTALQLGAAARYDRNFKVELGKKLGFLDGRPGYHWSVNGRLFPDTPILAVRKGELVRMTIANNSGAVHPMHLHGHHVLVLSRNGKPVTGSPWRVDILNVKADETYDVAFRAHNPGVWMFHCHNLPHAEDGLLTHLVYAGFSTPFRVGGDAHNHPE